MSEPPPLPPSPAQTLARIEQRLAQQQEKDEKRRKRAWTMFGCLMVIVALLMIPLLIILGSMIFAMMSGMSAMMPR